jgi:hypothetical protein
LHGSEVGGLIRYLYGPGRENEHTDPRHGPGGLTQVQIAPGWPVWQEGRLVGPGTVLQLPDDQAAHWCRRGWCVPVAMDRAA